ncbi:muconolactone Delta-isomerase family protein [Natrialba taiwanensis]|uniref:Muconolactone delta-isomerase n=1 Tax=Natrialba taiwanensis DSM 12281 TaxID=1230458 RepID=M0A0V0_9EURY|nr:muconolactone Delta-isomerase family protein [Natrialba taiwanensis]ELY92244.1 Muconolactone delta-isomerase [Natrialba taiwanensis DSM 12281]
MEFLVRVDGADVYDLPDDEATALIEKERERGRELMEDGIIQDFWRIPGKPVNIGIWSASDVDALEEALTSLPVWSYADIDVTPLASHPMTE